MVLVFDYIFVDARGAHLKITIHTTTFFLGVPCNANGDTVERARGGVVHTPGITSQSPGGDCCTRVMPQVGPRWGRPVGREARGVNDPPPCAFYRIHYIPVQVPKKGPTRLSRTGAIPVTSHRLFSRSSRHERPIGDVGGSLAEDMDSASPILVARNV